MGIIGTVARQARKAKKLSKKATEGQKKIEPAVREQRAYAKGQAKAAGATAALAGLGIAELRSRLKDAETEKERAQIKAAIEKTLRKMSEDDKPKRSVPRNSQSPRPKLRPKEMNKGGYANCGASMKPTQKSTNMAYGGMAKKK